MMFAWCCVRTVAFPVIDRNNGGTLPGTLAALARDMILDVADQVGTLVGEGMTYEQVAAANPTAAYEAK